MARFSHLLQWTFRHHGGLTKQPTSGRSRAKTLPPYNHPLVIEPLEARRLLAVQLDDPQALVGDVLSYQLSPDGQFGVYRGDTDTDEVVELYSVRFSDGKVTQLNAPLVDGGDVEPGFQISPDYKRVVYLADQDKDDIVELYSVGIGGGQVTKLNAPLVGGGDVDQTFRISSDSSRVVYLADQDTDTIRELYSVPIAGGSVTKLNDPLVDGGAVWDYEISADDGFVVYRADQDLDEVYELYSVSIEGGSATRLNGPLVENGDVWGPFQISPDSSHVVYLADQDTNGADEVYSVSIQGGNLIKLNPRLVENGDVGEFQISPDGQQVVYWADQESDGVRELYSVPVTGGDAHKLNDRLAAGGDVKMGFVISADSRYVVYRADQDTDTVDELYSVSITGGGATKLNDLLAGDGDVGLYRVSPDSDRVVYRADQETNNVFELYSVPISGGEVVKLNDSLVDGGSVELGFQISADSSRVAYRADQDTDNVRELYSVAMAGGRVTKLNAPLVSGGNVTEYELGADSDRVVYLADQETDGVFELYEVGMTGGSVRKWSAPLTALGDDVSSLAISPNGQSVVYRADQDTDGVNELYSVAITGGQVTKLNAPLVAGGTVGLFRISADSSQVVYMADQDENDTHELYSVAITGGPVTKLNDALNSDRDVAEFQISADSGRVVYRADQDTANVYELYSVAMTGGDVTKLNPPLVDSGNVREGFQVSVDGNRVVYLADQETNEVFELYSVGITGESVTRLNAPLVDGGDVKSKFQISLDAHRVVYVADQEMNGVDELYSVFITGGSATKLNDPLVGGGGVLSVFEISASGSRVVYWADQDTDNLYELYSAGITGDGATKLNAPLVSGGGVENGFQISADSRRVVYRARQDANDTVELYSVSIGGGNLTKLNPPLASGGDVELGVQTSADSSRVVYLADQDMDEVLELYSVSMTGGGVIRLNDPLVDNGDVLSEFQISVDSRRVVYRSDQDTDTLIGLYMVPLLPSDYGDAPQSYQVTFDENGARHGAAGPTLGSGRDVELDGTHSAAADADDVNGVPDDEDGVNLAALVAGTDVSFTIDVQQTPGTARVDAWVDFNDDGIWSRAEQIFDSHQLTAGISTLTFAVPADAQLGNTCARFRLSTAGNLQPTGQAEDGEVEDYVVTILGDLDVALTSDSGDDVILRLSSDNIEAIDNATSTLLASQPLAFTRSVFLHGVAEDNDRVTVDYSAGGFFTVPGGVYFYGGSGSSDELVIRGTGITQAVYHSTGMGLGEASIETSEGGQNGIISFSGVEPLSLRAMATFDINGPLHVAEQSLMADVRTFTTLDRLTTLSGGTIAAAGGLHLQAGGLISASGTIAAPITSAPGSAITLSGDAVLGDADAFDSMNLKGRLDIGAHTATLNDGHKAVLGSQTGLGIPGAADGILNAPNGVELPDTHTFVGQGEVNTPDGEFENQGFVQGSGSGLTFNHLVTGAGDYGGTVIFQGGTDFGNSPAQIDVLGSATFGPANTHVVEIGGLAPGEEYDQLHVRDQVNVNGHLQIVGLELNNEFTFQAGQTFQVLTFDSRSGDFSTYTGLDVAPGLRLVPEWQEHSLVLTTVATDLSPQVQTVAINAGLLDPPDLGNDEQPARWHTQRSDIRSLVVTFNEDVQVSANDLVLTNLGVNAPLDVDAPIALTQAHLSVSGNVLTLQFASYELPDGVYALEILPTVTDLAGNMLDGNGDGTGGDAYVLSGKSANGFYKLLGDWNGDEGISIFDFPTFGYWFSQVVPSVAPEYMDLNGDLGVSIFDFPLFANNFGVSVVFPPAGLGGDSMAPSAVRLTDAARHGIRLVQRAGTEPSRDARAHDAALLSLLAQWNGRPLLRLHDPLGEDCPTSHTDHHRNGELESLE